MKRKDEPSTIFESVGCDGARVEDMVLELKISWRTDDWSGVGYHVILSERKLPEVVNHVKPLPPLRFCQFNTEESMKVKENLSQAEHVRFAYPGNTKQLAG